MMLLLLSCAATLHTAVSAATIEEYDLPEKLYECVKAGEEKTSTTKIVYPDGNGPFHVVLYHHGAGGYAEPPGPSMEDWLMEMSDTGSFIIIAPKTPSCGGTACGKVPACQDLRDLYTALTQSREHRELHQALAKADFGRVGVLGHSMGAKHAPTFISMHPDANIKALVASHGGDDNETALSDLSVPVMFTTTADDTSSDRQPQIYNAFNLAGANHKVFARLLAGGHMEPEADKGGQLATMTSYFMSGHVNLNDEHKKHIYGTGPTTLCGGTLRFAEPESANCVVCEDLSTCPYVVAKITPPSSRRLVDTAFLV